MQTCGGPQCVVTCIALCLGWLLVTSALLFFTWNKVLGTVTKVKPVKFWHALLFLATICALAAPVAAMKRRHHHHGAADCCKEGGAAAGKMAPCPFERKSEPAKPAQ